MRIGLRDAQILLLRFGVLDREHTWAALGSRFGITQEGARQIAFRALRRLRAKLSTWPYPDPMDLIEHLTIQCSKSLTYGTRSRKRKSANYEC
jgi:hypothetical protein